MKSEEEKQAEYYDSVESDKEFDYSKAVRLKPEIKRVNINLPVSLFTEANNLGRVTGAGYQNTLKTAIAIGLSNLKNQISTPSH
tara:strand:+ start:499 stop:750 length:252 start_codon:yes stop_codon:yes gene_type:complete